MKKILYIWLIFAANMNLMAQLLPENNPNWQLVFEDEFDSFDTTKWFGRTPGTSNDWHVNAWSFLDQDTNCHTYLDRRTFLAENFYFETDTNDEYVVLKALKKDPPDTFLVTNWCVSPPVTSYEPFSYTIPAWLCSIEDWKYGYFESRFRLPYIDTTQNTIQGMGPAFWTIGGDGNEIDIGEFCNYSYYPPNDNLITKTPTTWPTLHYDNYNDNFSGSDLKTHINDGNFHKYAAKWSPERVDFYIDDIYKQSLDMLDSGNYCSAIDDQEIIFDLNIGFDAPYLPNDSTFFPYEMQIDWVRLYQLNQRCESDTTFCSFNPATFDFSLYKSINIGDGSCSISLSSANPIDLLAIDYIQINKGVTIPLGTELLLDFEQCQPDTESKGQEDPEDFRNLIFLHDYHKYHR
jgi:beta-glucanase (GH16 family)